MLPVVVTDVMIRGKKVSKSNAHVSFRSVLFKHADQIRYKSPSKKLGGGSKSSAESFRQDKARYYSLLY